jgi:soluble lytic murein transglycosylase
VLFRSKNDQALIIFQRDLILSVTAEDQARASFWIGKTQQALGDSTSAQAAWKQATSFDPTGYYSLRAQDMLFNRPPFNPSPVNNLTVDLAADRTEAESWLRVTFNLPADTDLSSPGSLLSDTRLTRGTEFWSLGLQDEARLEFEDLRTAIQNNPADCYRLTNYMLDLGLYRPAIFTARQVLTLAGETTQAQTLAAPRYFNHVRYGLYYQDIIAPAAEQSGFNLLFFYSVVRQESLFEGFVRSAAGARGLMQIIPSTGQEIANNFGWPPDFTPDDLYRPLVSINLGANYLMVNRNRLGGDLYATLAAYNAGAVSEEAWRNLSGTDPDLFLEVIRFSETSGYIRSIYENYNMYRLLYGLVP